MKYEVIPGGVTAPRGFLATGVAAGVKYRGKRDMALLYSETSASVAGVFTTNRVKAAPVLLTMERVASGSARAVVINSGNANACTGEQGLRDAKTMAVETARGLGIEEKDVLVASTGVIGVPMPMERIVPGIAAAAGALSRQGADAAAEAILTTDTCPKQIAVQLKLDGRTVTVGGMAKGSGMIHPNMATMLCFITTDAAVSAGCLHEILTWATKRSFNMISVDRDTSTNDMALLLANGRAGNQEINAPGEGYRLLQNAVLQVCIYLAKEIARDGEGAGRLIEVRVFNASTEKDARLAARSVVASNLVKAAVYGQDANWGRVLCAAGYSGASFDPKRADIFLGDIQVAANGGAVPFDEEAARREMQTDTVHILIDFKDGNAEAAAWGCDLTHEYVNINANYRT